MDSIGQISSSMEHQPSPTTSMSRREKWLHQTAEKVKGLVVGEIEKKHLSTYLEIKELGRNDREMVRPTRQEFKNITHYIEEALSGGRKDNLIFLQKGSRGIGHLSHSFIIQPDGTYYILLGKDRKARLNSDHDRKGAYKTLRRALYVDSAGHVTLKAGLKVNKEIATAKEENRLATEWQSDYVISAAELSFEYTKGSQEHLLMITTWAQGGDALDYFDDQKPQWQQAYPLFVDFAKGIQAIHAEGKMHRDVKPANFLVFTMPQSPPRAKIADLAFVTTTEHDFNWFQGTPHFFPAPIGSRPQTQQDDIYALGKTFEQLLGHVEDAPHKITMIASTMMRSFEKLSIDFVIKALESIAPNR